MRNLGAGLLLTLVAAILAVFPPGFLATLDSRLLDGFGVSLVPHAISGRVAIVAIDEKSLSEFGRWPWPRTLLGRLVQRINADGAAVTALDMVFPEPDTSGPPGAGGLSNDRFLAHSLATGRVVLGYQLGFRQVRKRPECGLRPAPIDIVHSGSSRTSPLFEAGSVLCSLPAFTRAAAGAGFLNAAPDADGRLRRVPLLIEYGGVAYPSLALAVWFAENHGRAVLLANRRGTTRLRLGTRDIPLDSRGGMLLNFRGPADTLPRISAADILAGRAPAGLLRDRIAVVGGSALGLQDVVATPVGASLEGVEVQATAIDNLEQGDFISRPGWALGLKLLLVLAAGFGSLICLLKLRPISAAFTLACGGVAVWALAAWLAASRQVLLSPLLPTAVLFGSLTIQVLLYSGAERKRRERADHQFAAARKFILAALASLTAVRHSETGGHLFRIQRFLKLLCDTLSSHPRFRPFLTPQTVDLLVQLAPIHDVGKVGVPDRILMKPGPLTPDEFQVIQRHVIYGWEILEDAREKSGIEDEALFRLARDIVYTHHERWDGTGYPRKLRGAAIPIPGRLVALADVYDALVSRRVYKSSLSHAEAVRIILAGRGTQFDPDVVDAFLDVEESWRQISQEILSEEPAANSRSPLS